MSDTINILFHGGDCDGKEESLPAALVPHDNAVCGNTVYQVYYLGDGNYLALLPSATPPAPPPAPTTTVQPLPDGDVLKAWHGAWTSVARTVPAYVNRVTSIRARIRSSGA